MFTSDFQTKLYELLNKEPGSDVTIRDLYVGIYGYRKRYVEFEGKRSALPDLTNRDMQQYLAPLFARMNVHLAGQKLKIVPGRLKQTYRLAPLNDE